MGGFRLIKEIRAEIESVRDQLEVGIDLELKLVVIHDPPAGLVDAPPLGLGRQRNGQRLRLAAVEQLITNLAEETAKSELIAVVEIGKILDPMRRHERAEFELDILVWGKLEFGFGLARPV